MDHVDDKTGVDLFLAPVKLASLKLYSFEGMVGASSEFLFEGLDI